MKITKLELTNFRNYTNSSTTFEDGLNFIVGHNAQGKTNLLESIYLLSVGKSPKNSKEKQLIKFNTEKAKISVDFLTVAGNKNIQMYLDKQDKKTISVNKLNILKITELVGILSVVYFSPDELKLIKEEAITNIEVKTAKGVKKLVDDEGKTKKYLVDIEKISYFKNGVECIIEDSFPSNDIDCSAELVTVTKHDTNKGYVIQEGEYFNVLSCMTGVYSDLKVIDYYVPVDYKLNENSCSELK